ncbi:hypothetical protein ACQKEX_14770 [Bacillus pumilus]|uniref:hypothetical protein n=1 Tax=Bacillus TaxID=1386 RepID=UPI000967ABAD|nr:hypothetical protein [Bacillus pumilus]MBU8576405.1 hypothetical protein [Bacillus pumilus]OLP64394.1 hypothetical protein BACPU_26190 [Bacillus pumilus]
MIIRTYTVTGYDKEGRDVEVNIEAISAKSAIEKAKKLDDGNTYNRALRAGCGCGS